MEISSLIFNQSIYHLSKFQYRSLDKENLAIFTSSIGKERRCFNNLRGKNKAGDFAPALKIKEGDIVSFTGYPSPLKTLIKKGKIKVRWSFYGGPLNLKDLSTDHIIPHSKGGPDTQANYVFCNAWQNSERSNYPLENFINWEAAGKYLEQFKGVKVGIFDGDKYIQDVLNSIQEALKSGR